MYLGWTGTEIFQWLQVKVGKRSIEGPFLMSVMSEQSEDIMGIITNWVNQGRYPLPGDTKMD